jgi:hypothetical protein
MVPKGASTVTSGRCETANLDPEFAKSAALRTTNVLNFVLTL